MGLFDQLASLITGRDPDRDKNNADWTIRNQWDQTNSRRGVLKSNIITDKELDDITRDELLGQLNDPNYLRWDQLDNIEKTLSEARTSQDEKYLNRRSVSNKAKERKERPGLAAQTILTSGLNPSGGSSGGTILT